MKRLTVLLCTLFLFLMGANSVPAVPMYYTFTGEISQDNSILDNAGIIAEAGIELGNFVEYVLMLDFERQSQNIWNDGSTTIYPDSDSDAYGGAVDRFYVDIVSGSLIEEKDGGSENGPRDIAVRNYGYISVGSTYLSGGSDNHTISVLDANFDFFGLNIGQKMLGFETARDSLGNASRLISILELTSISDTVAHAQVPEPATMLLLGTGLTGIIGYNFMRKTNKS